MTIAPKSYGYTGTEIAELLERYSVVCEFADPDYAVMMLTPEIGADGLSRVGEILSAIGRKAPVLQLPPPTVCGMARMSVREAMMAPSVELPVEECVGRVLANAGITCPPAIPVVICGEEISADAVSAMKYYGITTCRVVI